MVLSYIILYVHVKKTIMIMVKISTTGRILVRVYGQLIDTSCHNQSHSNEMPTINEKLFW